MSHAPAQPHAAVKVPRSAQIDLTSSINGRSYRLMISQPFAECPPAGYPVLWALDGQGYHGLVTNASRNRALAGEIEPVLVVAVGYPDDDPAVWLTRRTMDLTPTLPSEEATASWEVATAGGAGGLDRFLEMLEAEAMPQVEALFAIDRRRMALWGHSLGGLAVLHALFTRPAWFQSYLAISPSIWWDGRAVLANEAAFAEQLRSGAAAPRVFIAVGGLEGGAPSRLPPGYSGTLADAAERVASTQMIGNAHGLAERLRPLCGVAEFDVRFACAADETHMTVPFATLCAALDLAFAPSPGDGGRCHDDPLP